MDIIFYQIIMFMRIIAVLLVVLSVFFIGCTIQSNVQKSAETNSTGPNLEHLTEDKAPSSIRELGQDVAYKNAALRETCKILKPDDTVVLTTEDARAIRGAAHYYGYVSSTGSGTEWMCSYELSNESKITAKNKSRIVVTSVLNSTSMYGYFLKLINTAKSGEDTEKGEKYKYVEYPDILSGAHLIWSDDKGKNVFDGGYQQLFVQTDRAMILVECYSDLCNENEFEQMAQAIAAKYNK